MIVFVHSPCRLTGTLPEAVGRLAQLRIVRFRNNQLHGTLPSNLFAALGTLNRLDLGNNSLTGTIPDTVNDALSVALVDLSNNFLVRGVLLALPCPALPCPALPCPALPCPAAKCL
jgi:hypothetical protein